MIKIDFINNGNFIGFHASGHSLLNPGNDIVCSAVSALSYALLGTLENISGVIVEKNVSDGEMDISIKHDDSNHTKEAIFKVSNTVFSTICIGLKQVAKSYPDNVKVRVLPEKYKKASKAK